MSGPGILRKHENQRAEKRERHGAEQDDERIAEAVELRREHEENQDNSEQKRREEFAAFDAQLPRFAGIIDRVSLAAKSCAASSSRNFKAWSSGSGRTRPES